MVLDGCSKLLRLQKLYMKMHENCFELRATGADILSYGLQI